MTRILFAWELGANFGHLARDLPVATQLRREGHEVLFAVRDTRVAQQLLSPAGFRFVPCPKPANKPANRLHPINYSGILIANGFADPQELSARVHAWNLLFVSHKTQLVMFDHAPTALLAARACGVPVVITGTGFEVPPNVDTLPSIRPWDDIPNERLQTADTALLDRANAVLRQYKRPALQRVADLFSNVPTLLTTLPELDHYGARIDSEYVGPIAALNMAARYVWPNVMSKRVFVYVRPSAPGFEQILSALKDAHVSVLCVAPGIAPQVAARLASPSFVISREPMALGPLLSSANLAIASGASTLADALRAGVPLLMVPQVVEQALAAQRVAALGAGMLWRPERTLESAHRILSATLLNSTLRVEARRFALRYRNYSQENAIHTIVKTVLQTVA